nr:CaiB/BaiF CoA-transferase family protein [Roseomonas acroporae]
MRVVQMAAIGPVPLCTMLLADLGAEVLCIERPQADTPQAGTSQPGTSQAGTSQPRPPGTGPGSAGGPARIDIMRRGRTFVAVDLRRDEGRALAAALLDQADIVLEGFRPGVMERLGLGPETALARNPRLVYGRMTGWGQEGPLARNAGHDINYIALSGALHAIGRAGERPVPPLNLVGDYGGGALYLAFGVVCALHERARSGRGQVVDAAMVDGAASLMTAFQGMLADGRWRDERGVNRLDGGEPWYDTYETADGRHVGVGALEPQFWDELLRRLDIDPASLPPRDDRAGWPAIRARLTETFRARPRDHWAAVFAESDACVAPILSIGEAPSHPHHRARGTYATVDGVTQPAPAPRFGRTPGAIRPATVPDAAGLPALLRDWQVPEAVIAAARDAAALPGG